MTRLLKLADNLLPLLAAAGLFYILGVLIVGGLAHAQEVAAPAATTVDLSEFTAHALTAVALVLGAPASYYLARWASLALQRMGFELDDARRGFLQGLIERAIGEAAVRLGHSLDGKLKVDVQNKLVAEAVQYVATHGADTLKKLKADPRDLDQVEKIVRARASTVLTGNLPF